MVLTPDCGLGVYEQYRDRITAYPLTVNAGVSLVVILHWCCGDCDGCVSAATMCGRLSWWLVLP